MLRQILKYFTVSIVFCCAHFEVLITLGFPIIIIVLLEEIYSKKKVYMVYMWVKLFFSFGTISAFWHNSKVHRNNYLKFNRNFGQVSESVRRSPDNFDPFGNNFGRAYLVSAM